MSGVNIFTHYSQMENDFTNGFVSLLSLSRHERPGFVASFLSETLRINHHLEIDSYSVLSNVWGTVDAMLRGKDCCILFETKIASGNLCHDQIDRHLEVLGRPTESEKFRRLVLLTPDDGGSQYIRQFLMKDETRITHLSWKRARDLLQPIANENPATVFSEIVHQFLVHIQQMVFEEDMAGVILKVDFGDKSEVYAESYIANLRNGELKGWNTPREYKCLDGTGRKLLLYDKTRHAITVEVEIETVSKTNSEPSYPWTNVFALKDGVPVMHFFEPPIPINHIRMIPGFENFGVYKKDRNSHRNLTHEQYRQLISESALGTD